jgi:hypothetical protein
LAGKGKPAKWALMRHTEFGLEWSVSCFGYLERLAKLSRHVPETIHVHNLSPNVREMNGPNQDVT